MATAPPLLMLKDIDLTFGGTALLEGAELSVGAGERICLVGRNGSGKSTLMKIAAGLVDIDGGTRFLQPSATIRYLAQEPDFAGFATVETFVEAGLAPGDDHNRARRMLQSLGLSGEEAPQRLSGGEARRAALAQALAPEPDILLLDEPTNHLDVVAIEQLEKTLAGMRSAIVLVSHDRRFLENLSNRTVWLDRGKTRTLDRGFKHFEAWRDALIEEEERDAHKLDRKISEEEDWLRYGVTARRKRNVRRLSQLHALRDQRRQEKARRRPGDVKFGQQEAGASGKLVIEAKNISKRFDERVIVDDLSLLVERGDCIGIVGPNGAGKTTLIRLLTGQLSPDSGSIRLGTNIELVTLDQSRESLEDEKTVADVLTDGRGDTVIIGDMARHVVGYAKDFLFKPEQVRSPVTVLSGGERGRLMLARALARPCNLLILDEPTNDLDLETLDLLQEMLADFSGTLLLVSHDRDFLDRIVTSVLASDGDGIWTEYAGGYSDMVAQRGRGIGPRAAVEGPAPSQSKPTPARGSQPKRKLSFKDQHALTVLPGRIEALTQEISDLESKLSASDFYTRDPNGFAAAGQALTEVRAALAAAEEEWLRLELLREELERSDAMSSKLRNCT